MTNTPNAGRFRDTTAATAASVAARRERKITRMLAELRHLGVIRGNHIVIDPAKRTTTADVSWELAEFAPTDDERQMILHYVCGHSPDAIRQAIAFARVLRTDGTAR